MTEMTSFHQARSWRARARRMLLVLCAGGLAAILSVFGCSSGSDEVDDEAASIYDENTAVLLTIGVNRGDDLPASHDSVVIAVSGYEHWPASLARGGGTKAFGAFPVGEPHAFTVYPEGRDGVAIEVPFTMKKTMMSGTARAKTYVTVYRDSIIAEGPAIPEQRVAYPW